MDERRILAVDALLGLVLVTVGCNDGPGVGDDGETGTGDGDGDGDTTGDGDGDPSGDGDGDPAGDGDGDGDDFELVSAEIDGAGQIVTLHFSKPVAPLDGVDPGDFRISHAMPTYLVTGMGEYPEITYWDPNFYVEYYLSYGMPTMKRFEVESISPGDDAHDVRLQFGTPLDPAFCEYVTTYIIAYYPNYEAMFVHHAPGDIPLTSIDGEPLEAMGSQWVEEPFGVMTRLAEYTELEPDVPIPCPE